MLSQFIGNTPLVKIRHLNENPKVQIYGKMESLNPGGSVKDRPALWMIEQAEKTGILTPDTQLIEATSGNTGIALAMIAAIKNYKLELVMPEDATLERVQIMRAYGAKITLTASSKSMEGSIDYVAEKTKSGGYLVLNQFSNPNNPLSHYQSTAPEIWRQTKGQITHFVSAMGTTGTIVGTSTFFKEKNPAINIVGVRPAKGAKIAGIRRWPKAYLPKIFQSERVDTNMDITQAEAEQTAKDLAEKEGIFCGISAGGAMAVSLKLAKLLQSGLIVTVICDRGDRYLSTDIF